MEDREIGRTESLCPECLRRIPATRIRRGSRVFLEKTCPEHGDFSSVIWRGHTPMEDWYRRLNRSPRANPQTSELEGCPYDCGLCPDHRQGTCTAVLEVTKRCDLRCPFCFADGSEGGSDVPMDELIRRLEALSKREECVLQLSGGEPTVRDDLPYLVERARSMGFDFVQLNSNGLRISRDLPYLKKLARAGLDSVYLQFDGVDDSVHRTMRGRPMAEIKSKALENCSRTGVAAILVATLVPGRNLDQIGKIIRYGLSRVPTVRGVHLQPVSYFGRIPYIPKDEDRVTLPEVLELVESQTDGLFAKEHLVPPG
ncbi:radical SAM protein [Dethiosulfovibrio acidaminovorans]|uniref:Radical SAM protein n=3 Tax=Dethiosulfovibrionaceae TaxID=3029088 RepID=A0ABS9ENQ5_9BACT|nr:MULTISPECIES: radical SAM protein [Dethiosulfovibrio]MCF4114576.1 radical SAM protein [Dethiosulfovibrio russensis]MCF4142800.1 radical SAM protein [Dethiosulfovibrio marinus]MCF4144871.1 radical SAM protein [Dethiosulfovibrio acidaminovorans]